MLCPICKKTVREYNDPIAPNPLFPFCSERCKLIDLGRWLGERYHIPVDADDDSDDPPRRLPRDSR